MAPWISSQLAEPLLFAHRGGKAHAPENTPEAFALALKLGATGLESDVWVSKDNQPVLIHDDRYGPRFRRRLVAATDAADLPDSIITLPRLFELVGADYDLSLDIKTVDAIEPTVNALRGASEALGSDVVGRTWLCHPDLDVVIAWRERWSDLRLVHSTRLGKLDAGPERHGSILFEHGIDAVNFREGDWTGGLTALYHRFGIVCFGWDAHLERRAAELLNMGCDGVFSDYVDRMVAAFDRVYGPS